MPREFFTDFVKVAQDEGRHFSLLAERLKELGSFYGALPAHDGLWDSASTTSKDLLARLAIEHCVHEVSFLVSHYIKRESCVRQPHIRVILIFKTLELEFHKLIGHIIC